MDYAHLLSNFSDRLDKFVCSLFSNLATALVVIAERLAAAVYVAASFGVACAK